MEVELCECYTESIEIVPFSDADSCFIGSLWKFRDQLAKTPMLREDYMKEIKNESLTDYLYGEAVGELIFIKLQKPLIQNCDAYFNKMVETNEQAMADMKYTYDQAKLEFIKLLLTDGETAELIWERGNYHLVQGDTQNATNSYLKSLELTPDFIPAMLLMGWIHEQNRDFEQALHYYEKAQKLGMTPVITLIEIIKRKSSTTSVHQH